MSAGESSQAGAPMPPQAGALPPEILAILQASGNGSANVDPKGVSEEAIGGFYNPNFFGTQEYGGGFTVGGSRTYERPFYKNGDEWRVLQGLPPEELRAMQERLNFIGLLDEYRPGNFDQSGNTIKAVRTLLQISNRTGANWMQSLSEIETNIRSGVQKPFGAEDGPGAPQAPAFETLPDYASLKQKVKRKFKESLGRDPTQAEMKLFADSMMGDFQQQATQEFRRMADTRDVPQDVGAAHVPTQQGIDPVARFEEAFEQRMGGQIQTLEEQANTRTGAAMAQQQVNAADQIAGT